MESAPIEPSWIIAGTPRARSAELNRSRDGSAITLVWDCTAGEFEWRYGGDETVHILEGEAFIDDGSRTHKIRPGDVVLFRAGSRWRWSVPVYIRKVAFLRDPIPKPVLLGVLALRKLKTLPRGAARSLRRATTICCMASWWAYQLFAIAPAPADVWL